MQRQVSQLVPKRSVEVIAIGAKQDRAGTRQGNPGTPAGRASGGERVELAAIGNNDELKRTGHPAAETGPFGGAALRARAKSMARSRWPGHATAVTCPTRTAVGSP